VPVRPPPGHLHGTEEVNYHSRHIRNPHQQPKKCNIHKAITDKGRSMNLLNNLTISKKLMASYLVLAAVTALVGFIGIKNMSKINDLADQMYMEDLLGLS